MYLLIFFLSLVGFIVSSLLGRFVGYLGISLVTTAFMFISNLLSFLIFYEIVLNDSLCKIYLFNWVNIDTFVVNFELRFDSLTSLMLVIITTISLCAHFYSISYMRGDPHQSRFMAYLSLFTWFMIILVTSSNFFQLFLGWEGVGVCSFLLINFWFTRIQANKSALKAMLTNKISDICLTIGMFLVFYEFKSLDFDVVFNTIPFKLTNHDYSLDLICFLIMIGAVGKSAQVILHVWLPDAMEGPTPVSSLIHAATMVTAGIFLLIRCSYLFEFSNNILHLVIFLGALTAFFSSTTGFFQNDIKKVIAYSTCSQLGYMFFICGFSHYSISFYHLFNHAFFKALLFLTAGALIHSINNEQDIRNMGGFIKLFPFIYICLLVGSLSLMGFPFFTGFYSKDMIIESSLNTYLYSNPLLSNFVHSAYWLLVISVIFTALYSLRILIIIFFKSYSGPLYMLKNVDHSDYFIVIPLVYLSFLSIFIGYLTKDLIVGIGTPIWDYSIFNKFYLIDFEFYNFIYKNIPLILSIYSSIVVIILYNFCSVAFQYAKLNETIVKILTFFNYKWFFDKLYSDYLSSTLFKHSYEKFLKIFDKGIIELFGPYGITYQINKLIKLHSKTQTGLIYHIIGIILNIICYLIIIYIIISYII